MPQLHIEFFSSQIFWTLFCFGALYLLVAYLIIPMIESNFQKRRWHISSIKQEADLHISQAKKLHKEYTEEIALSEKEAQDLIENSILDLKQMNLDLLEEEKKKITQDQSETINQIKKQVSSIHSIIDENAVKGYSEKIIERILYDISGRNQLHSKDNNG